MTTEGLTEAEEQEGIRILNKVGARMSMAFYNAVAAKFVLTAIETVVLREHARNTQVLLTERSVNDVHYAGQMHSPGSMLRASDQPGSYADAFNRVQRSELKVTFCKEPEFVGNLFQYTERGPENGVVVICETKDEPAKGNFCDVDKLPANLIHHHYPIIDLAVSRFKK